MEKILQVNDLSVRFSLKDGDIIPVRNVSFSIESGKTMGLVGESGCGKSLTAFSILRLITPPGNIESGQVFYRGRNIMEMDDDEELRSIRGREIGMIFQEPMTSLNPVFTVGYQVSESIILHLDKSKSEAKDLAIDFMDQVGIPSPFKRYNSYPHEFSGGMRQRIMIAIALSASPSILIADEPTTALDVTIQSQILDLLLKLQEKRNMSLLLITHDLGVVANIADYIAIMYAGEIVEYGSTADIFNNPIHPYTKGLFEAIPKIGDKSERLKTIPGVVPMMKSQPRGCVFLPRCPIGTEECSLKNIDLRTLDDKRLVRCIKIDTPWN